MSTISGSVLITGGAGYIGSHTARVLIEAGRDVVVLDDLSTGHRWAVPPRARWVEGNVGDYALVLRVLREHSVTAVIHFAAHVVVPESVADPLKYYRNNVTASLALLEASRDVGVGRFIFSSSAAVYGIPERLPVDETAPPAPINPYGRSKLMTERMLADLGGAAGSPRDFRYVALRYFNVAGASLAGGLGQATPAATHLIKVACEAACGRREGVTVFGTDYDTADGTGVRDYVHVDDLARAHLAALEYLEQGGRSEVLNCGYGRGYSVREVLRTVQEVSGVAYPVIEGPRRAGDPPRLVADAGRIRRVLNWQPQHEDLGLICRTAWEWESRGLASRMDSVAQAADGG